VPILLVLLASVLFGTTGTTRALGLAAADPLTIGALRLVVGGLLLGAIALALERRRPRAPIRLRSARRPVLLVAAGAVGVVAYQPTFFSGVETNGVAVGTLVALGSAPVFTGLLSWALLRRRPEARWAACTAIAVAGIVLLSGVVDGGATGSISLAGCLASLAAGASYAVYTLAVKGLLDQGWTTIQAVGAVFGAAGAISLVELVVLGGAPVPDGRGLLAVLWLGIMTIAVAYVLFARGLERLPAATVSTLTLAEPVVATALGVVVLHEHLTAGAIGGGVLLLVALVLLGLPRRGRLRAAELA
jgi:drug/metabolite transporter, DME family